MDGEGLLPRGFAFLGLRAKLLLMGPAASSLGHFLRNSGDQNQEVDFNLVTFLRLEMPLS